MENIIQKHRAFVVGQIQKSFNSGINLSEEMGLEKAHQDGEMHPNGKWVWVASANGGKGDWRVANGRSHKKAGASSTTAAGNSKLTQQRAASVDKSNKKNDNSNVSKQSNSGYSDLTFDEAVKIGESHISAEEKSSIEKQPLRYLQEDAKYHKWDDDIKYQEGELKRAVDMKIGSTNFLAPNKVVTSEYKSKEIKRYANALATAKEREKLCKKALATAKAEKKHFLDNTGDNFTENEVTTYINKFRPKDEPNAVVENEWHTLAGRIGSTSAVIRVGSSKAKDINDGTPDWRPIGVYSYSTMGWDGKMMTITGTVQSWKEVKDCLSDTEDMRISIYKHPKQ